MEQRTIWYILTAVAICGILYLPGRFNYASKHASLSNEAEMPDIYLKNVEHYINEHSFDRSVYHLQKAIESIRKIEADVDVNSNELLESAVSKLQMVQGELLADSLVTEDMLHAFEYSLNALARTELKVSEMYAKTNRRDLAILALKHAKLHLRNAMMFRSSKQDANSVRFQLEKHVFLELDSLMTNELISPLQLVDKIDHIIHEMDQVVSK